MVRHAREGDVRKGCGGAAARALRHPAQALHLPAQALHHAARALRDAARTLCLACLLAAAMLSAFGPPAAADDSIYPARRKPQFEKQFGYAVFPYPYRLPGLGSGIALVGGAMNVADTYTDVYGIAFTGDVRGAAGGIADVHLVPRTLILDIGFGALNRASLQSYSQRGMDSGKDDYRILDIGDTAYRGARLTATFLERRFEVYGAWYLGASELKSVRDRDGNVIIEAQNAPRTTSHTTLVGARVDLTDDYADPRSGLRVDVTRTASPPKGSAANYYIMDYNVTGYIPVGKRSTWAFNLLRSDAHVITQGETDPAALQAEQGLDCASIADPTQQSFCNEVIANMVAQNRYGTATTLGGFSRLRAYSQGRYKGSHTIFAGTEFRWNLTEERTPIDIFILKDVRTAIQLAFFYEAGVTSDLRSELYERAKWRQDLGVGLRIVTASGVVFRGDVGYGRDGVGAAIFIGYPWEL